MINIKFLLEVLGASEEKLWYLKHCHREGSHTDKTKLKARKEGQEKAVSSPTTGSSQEPLTKIHGAFWHACNYVEKEVNSIISTLCHLRVPHAHED